MADAGNLFVLPVEKFQHFFSSMTYRVEGRIVFNPLWLVKVWFQNRRTKHKRMQQEEEAKTGTKSSSSGSKPDDGNQFNNSYEEEDEELIDMDMDELSESENET
ncbi:unnamed protein product, partial [Brenthis ino]